MNYIASYPKPGGKKWMQIVQPYNHIYQNKEAKGEREKAKTRQEIERGYGVNKDRVLEGSII